MIRRILAHAELKLYSCVYDLLVYLLALSASLMLTFIIALGLFIVPVHIILLPYNRMTNRIIVWLARRFSGALNCLFFAINLETSLWNTLRSVYGQRT